MHPEPADRDAASSTSETTDTGATEPESRASTATDRFAHRGRRRAGAGPVARVVDRRPKSRRSWRDLPHPSPRALLGVATLALIAGGAIHLSGSGSALPNDEGGAGGTGVVQAEQATGSPTSGTEPAVAAKTTGAPGSKATEAPPASAGSSGSPAPGGAPAASGPGAAGDGAPESGQSQTLVVHVTGQVKSPGVVRVPSGARIADAIDAAGGARSGADLAAINLARPVADGEQVHVPRPGEEPRAPADAAAAGGPNGSASGSSAGADGPYSGGASPGSSGGLVNINSADADELATLPGVGPATAAKIIEHREVNGPFRTVDDLIEVSGIGPAKLSTILPKATV